MRTLLTSEPFVRLACFAGAFLIMALWEAAAPRRERAAGRPLRWGNNLGVVVFDTLLLRFVLPTAAVGVALTAETGHWGLLTLTGWPGWAKVLVGIVALDLAIYLQHVLFHAVPALWRLHRMHHADLDIDVSTGVRFHPLEILLSMLIKIAVVAGIGIPALGVLVFEILLNATSLFNHANVRLPAPLDELLRRVLVTPDMHRVHHSIEPAETNSNFGFNFAFWDRLFGTYRGQPAAGHTGMIVGIPQFRAARELWLDRMLTQPFRDATGPQPFNGTPGLTASRNSDTSGP